LSQVELRIERGERVALVGSNGSGKTTLLRAILGLLRVEGRITIDGIDVATEPQRALAQMAYIPQVAPPLEAPVTEVVRAFSSLRGVTPDDVAARAARLGLALGSVGRARFRDLSGGMKQKLLAALALAAETPILLCDEPTANLDAAARRSFFEQINEGPTDRILILCSHRAEEVQKLVQRVIELQDGRVARSLSLPEPSRRISAPRAHAAISARADDAEAELLPRLVQ
jgi:ABC-2 type transport system ATP-binding protein